MKNIKNPNEHIEEIMREFNWNKVFEFTSSSLWRGYRYKNIDSLKKVAKGLLLRVTSGKAITSQTAGFLQ